MYRNGNYSAFYVSEPFKESNLGANTAKDFVSYNLLRAWKGKDPQFPFIDSHNKNYNVRDDSDWEKTLKPRLHDRISNSKNIILFLSSKTKRSKALTEEMDYGINVKGLPIIVVYPEYENNSDIVDLNKKQIKEDVKKLWDKLPAFKNSMNKVPTIHIPLKKELITRALNDSDFTIQHKGESKIYFYTD